MILIDYSQIALANIIVQKLQDEDLIRHMILNSIRMYNRRFREEYGQMVICADGMASWRYEYYPYYKANRKTRRGKSDLDWPDIFRVLNMVRDEIKENLPYKVMHMDHCEADDIIGALTYNTQEFGQHEPVVIISSDKDFIQLQKFNNVKQFSPMQKRYIPVTEGKRFNARSYLFEHICRGDTGDGIPNILSTDDCLVEKDLRQSPLKQSIIEFYMENCDIEGMNMPSEVFRNFQRNKTLIDLNEIPKHIYNTIIQEFIEQKPAHRMKVLNYLIKKRCRNLIESVEEFYNG
jgi:hypothetical protein